MTKQTTAGYRVTNWPQYNAALRQRGSLTVWIAEAVLADWQNVAALNVGKPGAPFRYPDLVVESLLQLGAVFHQPLRQTQGLSRSILKLLDVGLRVPDYTTLSRRRSRLSGSLPTIPKDSIDLVVDSTGLKFYGEGEWKRKKHGFGRHRMWRKLHLGADSDGEIRVELLTENNVTDASATDDLLEQSDQTNSTITAFFGDGAYDQRKVYDALSARGIPKVVIPPQKNAKIWLHGNSKAPPHPRDENLRSIRRTSRTGWKQRSGYHTRSLSETAMFRYKRIIGERVQARTLKGQRVETRMGVQVLNQMFALGMPDSTWRGHLSVASGARAIRRTG